MSKRKRSTDQSDSWKRKPRRKKLPAWLRQKLAAEYALLAEVVAMDREFREIAKGEHFVTRPEDKPAAMSTL